MSVDDRPRCGWGFRDDLMLRYHDEEWGVPVRDDLRVTCFRYGERKGRKKAG